MRFVSCTAGIRILAGTRVREFVNLYVADPVHIAYNGVKLTTLAADTQVASIRAEFTLQNEGLTNRRV